MSKNTEDQQEISQEDFHRIKVGEGGLVRKLFGTMLEDKVAPAFRRAYEDAEKAPKGLQRIILGSASDDYKMGEGFTVDGGQMLHPSRMLLGCQLSARSATYSRYG